MNTLKQSKKKTLDFLRYFSKKHPILSRGCIVVLSCIVSFAGIYALLLPHQSTRTVSTKNQVDHHEIVSPLESPKQAAPETLVEKKPEDKENATPNPVGTPQPPVQPRASASLPTALAPLKVIGFIAGTYVSCSGSGGLGFSYAYINTNVSAAGSIHWQIEERQGGAINIIGTGDTSLAERTGTYQLGGLEQYKVRQVNEDSAIRLHVTSPNDISSIWYTPDYGFNTCPGVGY